MLKGVLAGDNLKAFLHEYRHYHSHWPLIHAPTFDPLTANLGLVLTMCCIGAVYSEKLSPKDLRWFMEVVRGAVLRSSYIYKLLQLPEQTDQFAQIVSTHLEELQSLVLLHSLFVWHGSQQQRQQGREEFGTLANIARRAGLLQALPRSDPRSSLLHTTGPITGEEVDTWSWTSWIENEQRVRLMAYVFLIDASATIFFNNRPEFDVYEITAPLPADDAAWEARTAEACASALGLRGQAAQQSNVSGSRRAKQLGMAEALHVLYGAGPGRFPERATNVFGKFSTYHVLWQAALVANFTAVLIHAIHSQIYNIQRQLLRRSSANGTNTPPDGVTGQLGGVTEQTQQLLRSTFNAIELWKHVWDADLAMQFTQTQKQRRHGFCRDGVHFYFLAQIFLRNSRPQEWAAPADLRCRQVFHLLKQIRSHVANDSAQKGIDLGSGNTVADDYAITDLTLNMRRLFAPLNDPPETSSTYAPQTQYANTIPLQS